MTLNDSDGMVADAAKEQKGDGKGVKRKFREGELRLWLRVYETLPAQMLNAYGVGRCTLPAEKSIWEH